MNKIGLFFKKAGASVAGIAKKGARFVAANKVKSIVIGSVAAVTIGGTATTVALLSGHDHTPGSAIVENYVAATCDSFGSYDEVVYCTDCSEEISRTPITLAAAGHTVVTDDAVAATCTADGLTEGKHCSVCNTVLVAQTSVDALGHNDIPHDAKVPTCTEIGWDAYVTCSRCSYTTYVEKPALDHDEISHDPQAPTCTEIGWDAYVTCSRCNYTTYSEKPALDHDEISHDPQDPTCTEIGWDAYVTCSRCSYTTYVEKPALDHDEISHDSQDPTCTEIGWDAYVTCSRCNYTTYNEKPATGHSYTSSVTTPTCTSKGYTTHTCHCSDSYVNNYVDELDHAEISHNAKAPTCTEIGWDAYVTCSRCSYTTYNEKAATGHTVVIDPAVAAGCTTTGLTEGKHCSVCSTVLVAQSTTSALGHSYTSAATAPTCTAKGYTTHTCHCGVSYVDNYVNELGHAETSHAAKAPTCTEIGWDAYVTCSRCDYNTYNERSATGHSFGNWITTVQPTESANGEKRRDCENCDAFETDIVAMLAHDHSRWITVTLSAVAPTCTTTGLTEGKKCSGCGEVIVAQNTVAALGHNAVNHNAKAPTCTEIGWDAYVTCSRCDYTTYKEKAATGHTYTPAVTAPTCAEKGYTTHTCHCGDSYVNTYVDELGHNAVSHSAKAPTCTAIGWDAYVTCSRCDYTTYKEKAATGHTYTLTVTAPTCTEKGYTTHTCHCGDSYVDTYVDELGHSAVNHSAKAPTCTEIGWDAYVTCSRCDYTTYSEKAATGHTVVIDPAVAAGCATTGLTEGKHCSVCSTVLVAQSTTSALGHSYTSAVTAPTCTAKGYTTHTCHCGDSYVGNYVSELGHNTIVDNAVAPTCTVIGLTEGSHCSYCGEIFIAQEEIAALGHIEHNYEGKPATCLDIGWEPYFTCDRNGCGFSSLEIINALGHDEIQHSEVLPTCQTVGYTAYVTCSRCDYKTKTVEIPKVDHLFTNYTLSFNESNYDCFDRSYHRTATCDYGCGAISEMIVERGPHDAVYYTEVVAPTATRDGYIIYTVFCGNDDYLDRECEHIYDDGRITLPATGGGSGASTNEGKWRANALLSNVPYPGDFSVDYLLLNYADEAYMDYYGYAGGLFHSSSSSAVEAYINRVKSSNFRYSQSTTSASYIGYNIDRTLMLVVGYVGDEVSVMVYKMKDVNLGGSSSGGSSSDGSHVHTYQSFGEDPTCIDEGYTLYYCNCGHTSFKSLAQTKHANAEPIPTVEPTCTEAGLSQGRYCPDCDKIIVVQKEIPALGHNDENGYCTRCNVPIEYTITFVAEGVTVDTRIYTVETNSITNPEIPAKVGHTGVWADFELGTQSFTVEAIYTKNTYTVTYVMNGGVNNAENPVKYTYGDTIPLKQPTIGEPLVIFGGWFTDPSFIASSAFSGITPETDGDLKLYAQWLYYRIESAEGFELDYNAEMPTIRIRVGSDAESFNFNGKITVSTGCKYNVYKDAYASQSYDMKLVPLSTGDNIFYIVVFHPNGENYTQYKVEIYRRHTYTYTYLDATGKSFLTGIVEEDSALPLADAPDYAGYTFVNWRINSTDISFPYYPYSDITLSPIYTPNTDTKYKVEYYLENVNDSGYTLYETDILEGTTDTTARAVVKNYPHFTFNDDMSILSGNIDGNGSRVLQVYYKRDTHEISCYLYNKLSGAVYGDGTFKYGKEITLNAVTNPGYTFIGWYNETGKICDSLAYTFTVEKDVELIVVWEANTNTPYKVEYYLENLDGDAYTLFETDNLEGTTDTYTYASIKSFKGFTYSASMSNTGGNVNGNGSLVLKVYYTRGPYTLSASSNVGTISNAGSYRYEAVEPFETEVTAVKLGYEFKGWYNGDTLLSTESTYTFTAEMHVEARFDVVEELKDCDFTSTSTTCEITGLKNKNATTIVIPDCVTKIAENAFKDCTNLVSVTIPDSVTSIGEYAFRNCSSLTSVTIGNSVTSIGYEAFYYCYKLVEVMNKSSLNITAGFSSSGYGYVAYYAKEVHSGESKIVNYNDYLFYTYNGVNYLLGYVGDDVNLVLPESYNGNAYEIYRYAFYDRDDIISVTITDSVTSIGDYAFYYCNSLTSVTIGNGVTSIGYEAFYDCDSLTSVTIPDSVTSIGYEAFYNCTALEEIFFNAIAMNDLSYKNYVFAYAGQSGNGIKVVIGKNVTKIPAHLFDPYSSLSYAPKIVSVEFEEGSVCTSIGSYAFYDCDSLTSITIPDSVTSIGDRAFYYCSRLTSVTIGDGVTSIDSYAFYNCTALEEIYFNATAMNDLSYDNYVFYKAGRSGNGIKVVIGKNVTKIPAYLFYPYLDSNSYAPRIVSVEFEEGSVCTSIGSYAFYYCNSLTSVYITDIASWCHISFGNTYANPLYYAKNLYLNGELVTDLVIPDSVTSIGSYAFYYCSRLTSVTIGDGVTSIGSYAFYYCTALEEIHFNATAMNDLSYDNYVFYKAGRSGNGIKVVIGKNVTKIPAYLFDPYSDSNSYAPKIVSVEFEEGSVCTSIGSYAFDYCDGLISVTIPDSVTSIGNSAFYGCTSLEEIYFNATAMNDLSSDNYVFYNAGENGNGIMVIVGANVTKIPSYLFYPYISSSSPKIIGVEFEEGSVCQSIGSYAFYNCSSLTCITIPNSVASIGEGAFYCSCLTFYCEEESKPSGWVYNWKFSGSPVVWDCNNNEVADDGYIYIVVDGIRYGIKDGVAKVVGQPRNIAVANIPESISYKGVSYSVTSIDDCAFQNCYYLKSVTIPDTITCISYGAFDYCTSLICITIPKSVTYIGHYAFNNCSSLTSIKYRGTSSQWNAISKAQYWDYYTESYTITYNC